MNENLIPVANPYIEDIEKEYLFKALEKGEISSQGSFVGQFYIRSDRYHYGLSLLDFPPCANDSLDLAVII